MDDEPPPCADCGATRGVNWCLAFDAWLCAEHRTQRSYKLLDSMPSLIPLPS